LADSLSALNREKIRINSVACDLFLEFPNSSNICPTKKIHSGFQRICSLFADVLKTVVFDMIGIEPTHIVSPCAKRGLEKACPGVKEIVLLMQI
jgi:hypothetical protein